MGNINSQDNLNNTMPTQGINSLNTQIPTQQPLQSTPVQQPMQTPSQVQQTPVQQPLQTSTSPTQTNSVASQTVQQENVDLSKTQVPFQQVSEPTENQTSNSTPKPPQNTEKKSKKGIMGCCLVIFILLLVLVIVVGIISFILYKRFTDVKNVTDLGVTYTTADYDDAITNLGIEVADEDFCISCGILEYSDPHEAYVTFTNAQASAFVDQYMTYKITTESGSVAELSNPQVKFSDGQAEFTTTILYEGKSYPIYLLGTFSKETETSIIGSISKIKVGAFTLPESMNEYIAEALVTIANAKISEVGDSVRIDTLEITDNGLVFSGALPSKAENVGSEFYNQINDYSEE